MSDFTNPRDAAEALRFAELAHRSGDLRRFAAALCHVERLETGRLGQLARLRRWALDERMLDLDWDDVADLLADSAAGAAMEIAEGRS